MKIIRDCAMDAERALYGEKDIQLINVAFDGPADGESAVKECRNVVVQQGYCNLRYPFWHVDHLVIQDTELTPLCRAALWYSNNVTISGSHLHGIKAVRECRDVTIVDSDIDSTEFGWSTKGMTMNNTSVKGEYFMMRSSNLYFDNVRLNGKYSFQYVNHARLTGCDLNTKDAFWHAHDMVIKDSVVKGEYLAWYSNKLTFVNCTIIGTQPFCYCRKLRLINCKMIDTDLCFERSHVHAEVTTPVISIKNVYSGVVTVPSVGEIIHDDSRAKGRIVQTATDHP